MQLEPKLQMTTSSALFAALVLGVVGLGQDDASSFATPTAATSQTSLPNQTQSTVAFPYSVQASAWFNFMPGVTLDNRRRHCTTLIVSFRVDNVAHNMPAGTVVKSVGLSKNGNRLWVQTKVEPRPSGDGSVQGTVRGCAVAGLNVGDGADITIDLRIPEASITAAGKTILSAAY